MFRFKVNPFEAVHNVLDTLITSPEERAQAQAVFEKLKQHPGALQTALNKIEAKHMIEYNAKQNRKGVSFKIFKDRSRRMRLESWM